MFPDPSLFASVKFNLMISEIYWAHPLGLKWDPVSPLGPIRNQDQIGIINLQNTMIKQPQLARVHFYGGSFCEDQRLYAQASKPLSLSFGSL